MEKHESDDRRICLLLYERQEVMKNRNLLRSNGARDVMIIKISVKNKRGLRTQCTAQFFFFLHENLFKKNTFVSYSWFILKNVTINFLLLNMICIMSPYCDVSGVSRYFIALQSSPTRCTTALQKFKLGGLQAGHLFQNNVLHG